MKLNAASPRCSSCCIKHDSKSVRCEIEYASWLSLQDLPLFNDTIYYNILYGRLGASQEDIFQAAQQAAVHDQILAMPDG